MKNRVQAWALMLLVRGIIIIAGAAAWWRVGSMSE